MFVGHFALGVAMKARFADVPTAPLLLGVALMDIVDGFLIATGIDRVRPDLGAGPYLFFDLSFIDWDHSLVMAVLLSIGWALLFRARPRVALLAGAAVFSHFLADLPVHNDDLALYPFALEHMGFGLWGKLQTGAWILEGIFAAMLLAYAAVRAARSRVGLGPVALFLAVLFVTMSPWFSPMRGIAHWSEPWTHIGHGLLVGLGFLFSALILTRLIDRAYRRSGTSAALAAA